MGKALKLSAWISLSYWDVKASLLTWSKEPLPKPFLIFISAVNWETPSTLPKLSKCLKDSVAALADLEAAAVSAKTLSAPKSWRSFSINCWYKY